MKVISISLIAALLASSITGAPVESKRATTAPIDRAANPLSDVWSKRDAAAPIDRAANPLSNVWSKRDKSQII